MYVKFWLLSVLAVLSMMPIGHMIVMLLREIEDTSIWITTHMVIGLLGVILIHHGNRREETPASIFGFLGAHLIFIGFFEFSFAFIADVLNIAPVMNPKNQEVLLAPSLQVVELSGLILLPLMLLLSINHQVRCNMMVWIRRRLKMNISFTTNNKQRPYANIAANETLFIIWTIYVISLLCLDPRVLGPTHWLSMSIYSLFMIWPLYLIYRIRRFTSNGYVFRYAIPVGVLLWSWVEMFSSMNIIHEYYLYPLMYPIANLVTLLCAAILVTFTLLINNKYPRVKVRSSDN